MLKTSFCRLAHTGSLMELKEDLCWVWSCTEGRIAVGSPLSQPSSSFSILLARTTMSGMLGLDKYILWQILRVILERSTMKPIIAQYGGSAISGLTSSAAVPMVITGYLRLWWMSAPKVSGRPMENEISLLKSDSACAGGY